VEWRTVGAVRLRFRAEARQRWRAWLLLAVVVGLAAGGAMAALAGARRTETSYRRFVEGTRGFDVLVTNGSSPELINRQFDLDEVARLPQVAESAPIRYWFGSGQTASGRPLAVPDITPFAGVDGRFGTELNRAEPLDGRLPRAEDELAVSFLAAERYDIDVGDTLPLAMPGPGAFAAGPGGPPPPVTDFRVVGVVAVQGAFPPLSSAGSIPPLVLLSEAFATANPDAAEVLAVRLAGGRSDVSAFTAELERLAPGTQIITLSERELSPVVQRGLDVQATVLRVLAGVLAVVALLVATLTLQREVVVSAADDGVLAALGVTLWQRRTVGAARAAVVAGAAALVAVVTAVALSPLAPVGVARQAELHTGLQANLALLAIGAGATVVLLTLAGVVPVWWGTRAARRRTGDDMGSHPSRIATALTRSGAPTAVTAGVRLALEPGRAATAVPVRSTILGTALGVAIIAAVLSFTSSVGHLFEEPSLYGWNWDVQVGSAFSPELAEDAARIAADPAVAAVALAGQARLTIDGEQVDTLGLERVQGTVEPTVVEGRMASAPDEVLLGGRTMRDLDLSLGDETPVTFGDRTVRVRVVGKGVLGEFAGAAGLGEGAAMTIDGLRRFVPDTIRNFVLIRARPGADQDALADGLRLDHPDEGVFVPAKPSDLADLERVSSLPFVVAGLLGVLALATLASTVATSVRRRRRELALLKVLGFVRSQVQATVAWQASTLAVVAGLIGVPLGVAAGRTAWDVFAERLGVPPRPVMPVLAIALLVPLLLVLANVVAAVPGRVAARMRPAAALRTE
jgi:ABC-type lipoprotein release transport system permease subunit